MTVFAYVGIVGFILLCSGQVADQEIARRSMEIGSVAEIVANDLRGDVFLGSIAAHSGAASDFANASQQGEVPIETVSALESVFTAIVHSNAAVQKISYVDMNGVERLGVSREGTIVQPPETSLSSHADSIASAEFLPDHRAWMDIAVQEGVGMLAYLVPVTDQEGVRMGVIILHMPIEEALASVWGRFSGEDLMLYGENSGVLTGDGSRQGLLRTGTYAGSLKMSDTVTVDRRNIRSENHRADHHILLSEIPYQGTLGGEQLQIASFVSHQQLLADYSFMQEWFLKLGIWVVFIWLTYGVIAFWLASGMIPIYRVLKAYMRGNYDISVRKIRSDETGTIAQAVNNLLETARIAERDRKNFTKYATEQLRMPAAVIADRLHEVKTVLEKKRAEKSMMAVVEAAEKQNRHSLRVSNTFLTYMEFGEHYKIGKRSRVNVNALVQRLLAEHAQSVQENRLKLNVKIPKEHFVFVHEEGIVVALKQIIWNAMDYSNNGGKIDIIAERTDEGIAISVIDEGIGIPAEEASEIFQGFYRASNAFYRKNVGSGLGLAITKRIVEAHGGRVSFRSAEGKGSAFTITLPTGKK